LQPEGGMAEGGVAEGGVAEGGVAEGGVAEGGQFKDHDPPRGQDAAGESGVLMSAMPHA
jgi:hypothetical protein